MNGSMGEHTGLGFGWGAGWTKPVVGYVRIMRDKPTDFELDTWEKDWIDVARKHFPAHKEKIKKEKVWIVEVPESCVKDALTIRRVVPSFSPCTFNAADAFTKHILGVELDNDDKDWLACHPFAESGGLAMANTATCVHQLVEPYGLGVYRIRLPLGSLVEHPELRRWVRALGMNPFALTDGRTTNAEAATRLGVPLAQAQEMWRFEYGEHCLQPSIVGKKFGIGGAVRSYTAGAESGHASYVGARGKCDDWNISIQLGRHVKYTGQLVLPTYEEKEYEQSQCLVLSSINKPDGTRLAMQQMGKWIDAADAKPNLGFMPSSYTPPNYSLATADPAEDEWEFGSGFNPQHRGHGG